jgi:hypothetical protein
MLGGANHAPWGCGAFCVLGFEDHESRCAVSSSTNGRSEVVCDNGQVGYGAFGLQGKK